MRNVRAAAALLALTSFGVASAQDVLQEMPRYDRYEKLRREIAGSVRSGAVPVSWAEDGQSLTYPRGGKTYRLDVRSGEEAEAEEPASQPVARARRGPERGRQFDSAGSPDGKLKAIHRDGNVYLSKADGTGEVALTQDGSRDKRIKYGIASWVYGEELGVREAMWWSPDSKYLAFYRFDEAPVKDYYLQYDQTKIQDTLDVEAYPKAGTDNPKVRLLIYDLERKSSVDVDTAFGDSTLGEYIYDVKWSPDGGSLLFSRTNRKQNIMELCIAEPRSGKARAIVRETQLQSWADNHPETSFLKDKNRFIWSSERNGYKNLYLYDLSGKQLAALTQHKADVERIVRVDEDRKILFYTARTGDNPYLSQLHRVGLDGKGDRRLTDPSFTHTISLAPDGRHFADIAQNAKTPPTTRVLSENGTMVKLLGESELTKFRELKLRPAERFSFPAADGTTTLYGSLHFPSDFDPSHRYPLIVSVYGGPESGGGAETFQSPNAITEMGFLYATFEGRGTNGRGKAFRDAVYGKLGIVEIDDQAAGVKALAQRPYVDGKRVGIFGTSYGGYASIMAILRHPDVFHAACASSSVTDWRHYDTIYTERFQGLPWENDNLKGYEEGSAMKYVRNLKGKLMLYYGTADNNVHPSNTLQLVQALESAGKRYDMQVGPDRGHTGMNTTRMWEYFVTHLILRAPREDALATVWRSRR
jgi:dipeptidyl-peptidase-4